MRIKLSGYRLTFDPPQHLAMIEVKRLSDGLSFKVLHESGHESEDVEVREVSLPQAEMQRWVEAWRSSVSVALQSTGRQFPIVAEIDLRLLPPHYQFIPAVLPPDFAFTIGERFRVFVIGDEMLETVVDVH